MLGVPSLFFRMVRTPDCTSCAEYSLFLAFLISRVVHVIFRMFPQVISNVERRIDWIGTTFHSYLTTYLTVRDEKES